MEHIIIAVEVVIRNKRLYAAQKNFVVPKSNVFCYVTECCDRISMLSLWRRDLEPSGDPCYHAAAASSSAHVEKVTCERAFRGPVGRRPGREK